MTVVITGIGLQTCLGNLTQSWQLLLEGKTGIEKHQIFPEFPPIPLGLIGKSPIKFSELVDSLIKATLQDAKLTPPLADCGVVIGSSRGCQGIWEELTTQPQRLPNWLEYLPHQGAIAVARQIEATGIVLAPMAACNTGIVALARGFELIKTGECDRAIVGALETPITRLTLAGFQKMGALAQTGCYPFDQQREGLVLGEGGAFFVLEKKQSAESRNAPIYGQIRGFGLTCDAYHPSSPDPKLDRALWAIKSCLTRSKLAPDQINYIHLHGTSTRLNDQMEASLIKSLFSHTIPVSSTKGATGHTLGASGAIGVAFSLLALRDQILPPCVGLKQPEFSLNFVRKTHPTLVNNILCFGFGFGGNNGVIALSKLED
jgi:3-oxoacyl-[acyl-carrier-protein] synthase II